MSVMLEEALDAAAKIRAALSTTERSFEDLGRRLRELDPDFIATIARGSSDHVANYAAYLFPQVTGHVVASIPPSTVSVSAANLRLRGQFVLSISQSGGSPDLLLATERARASGALTAALVNETNSQLARTAEVVIPQAVGPEKSLAATKSVLGSMVAVARLAAAWGQDDLLLRALQDLPSRLEQRVEREPPSELLENVSHAFVISRSLGFSSAQEVALKLKETCGLHAEAFSAAEVRHGPREIVDDRYLVIALALPGADEKNVIASALELGEQGARVLIVGAESLRVTKAQHFVLPTTVDPRLAPILALNAIYPWLARVSVALGRDPDKPRHLASKTIKTL